MDIHRKFCPEKMQGLQQKMDSMFFLCLFPLFLIPFFLFFKNQKPKIKSKPKKPNTKKKKKKLKLKNEILIERRGKEIISSALLLFSLLLFYFIYVTNFFFLFLFFSAFFDEWKEKVYNLCNTTPDLNKTSAKLEEVLKSALASPRPHPSPLSQPSLLPPPTLLSLQPSSSPPPEEEIVAKPANLEGDEIPIIVEPPEESSSTPSGHPYGKILYPPPPPPALLSPERSLPLPLPKEEITMKPANLEGVPLFLLQKVFIVLF